MQLPEETKSYIREELGTKAVDTYKELGRGCWVFTRNNTASFVCVADINTVYSPKYPNETAMLLLMIAQYNPERQAVVILSVKRGQQILSNVSFG